VKKVRPEIPPSAYNSCVLTTRGFWGFTPSNCRRNSIERDLIWVESKALGRRILKESSLNSNHPPASAPNNSFSSLSASRISLGRLTLFTRNIVLHVADPLAKILPSDSCLCRRPTASLQLLMAISLYCSSRRMTILC
jgi:hypothetical protein